MDVFSALICLTGGFFDPGTVGPVLQVELPGLVENADFRKIFVVGDIGFVKPGQNKTDTGHIRPSCGFPRSIRQLRRDKVEFHNCGDVRGTCIRQTDIPHPLSAFTRCIGCCHLTVIRNSLGDLLRVCMIVDIQRRTGIGIEHNRSRPFKVICPHCQRIVLAKHCRCQICRSQGNAKLCCIRTLCRGNPGNLVAVQFHRNLVNRLVQ